MLNFYLFPSKSKLDGSRSIPRSLQSSLSLESCPRNRSRIFEDFRGRGKRKNEKLLKRAAKPSPTFIINSTLSPMVFYAVRWFFTPPDGSQFSTRRTGPPFRSTTTITRSSLPGRVTTRREISRYRRASNLVLTSPRPRGDGGDRRTAAIRALKWRAVERKGSESSIREFFRESSSSSVLASNAWGDIKRNNSTNERMFDVRPDSSREKNFPVSISRRENSRG